MGRLPRFALPGQPQHVIQRGNDRIPIFVASADYALFLECLLTACRRYECQVHAYVLMTNHFHLLMTPRSTSGISRTMQSVGCRYVRHFNTSYQRTGTLWEGRYRAAPIDSERYLLTCYRYIELNPVRARLVQGAEDYRWSSHRANAYGHADPLVTPHERYVTLGTDDGSREVAYRALSRHALDDRRLREIRKLTNTNWTLGSERFRKSVARLVHRPTEPSLRGGARVGAGRPKTNGVRHH